MKIAFLFLAVLGACLAEQQVVDIFVPHHGIRDPDPPHVLARSVQWLSIQQPVDNFDPKNTGTWNMRAIKNDQFFRPGGPIFIMIGAEWTISEGWLQSGNMFTMAQQHGGLMFYTEHRYYGKSQPFNDLSTASLKYLSTPQALADLANFCRYLKQTYPGSKIVVVGGSYAGNMAIWMREKYPDLIHAAVSSSAPVLAEMNFYQYYEVVATVLTPRTNQIIQNAVAETVRLINSGSAGIQKVSQDYNLCQTLNVNDRLEVYYMFLTIMGGFAGKVQNSNANTAAEIESDLLNTGGATDYDKLAAYIAQGGCKSTNANFIAYFRQTGLNTGDSRQWIYQTCTEYGFFQTGDSKKQPFGQNCPVDLFVSWCLGLFGNQFTSQVVSNGVAQTNANYGGLNPKVTRVVSVHGTHDPWHALGLSRDVNPQAPVIVVPGTSHTADLGSPSGWDSKELAAAKTRVRNLIAQWLAEP